MKVKKIFIDKVMSKIGIGTYKGEINKAADLEWEKSILYGIKKGINVIDTAQKYRNGKSEELIGKIFSRPQIKRENFTIISKAGLLPEYVKKKIDNNIIKIDKKNYIKKLDFCIDPRYMSWSIENSLNKMKLKYIDYYLIHNPEHALELKNGEEKLINSFKVLEKKRDEGKISLYGMASWSGFRIGKESNKYINIERLLNIVKKKFGKNHGFRCLEIPFSIGMPDVASYRTLSGKSLKNFSLEEKISIFISAPMYEGKIIELLNLNLLFNNMKKFEKVDLESKKFKISLPESINSSLRLFRLLINLKRKKIYLKKYLKKLSRSKSMYVCFLNFVKYQDFCKVILAGFDKEKYCKENLNLLDAYNKKIERSSRQLLKKII